MKNSGKKRLRLLAIAAFALLLGVISQVGVWHYLKKAQAPTWSLGQMLWVTDWELEKFYQPGSYKQQLVVAQLGDIATEMQFSGPILYRMGGKTTDNITEGILLYPFDPSRPEMAKTLIGKE